MGQAFFLAPRNQLFTDTRRMKNNERPAVLLFTQNKCTPRVSEGVRLGMGSCSPCCFCPQGAFVSSRSPAVHPRCSRQSEAKAVSGPCDVRLLLGKAVRSSVQSSAPAHPRLLQAALGSGVINQLLQTMLSASTVQRTHAEPRQKLIYPISSPLAHLSFHETPPRMFGVG